MSHSAWRLHGSTRTEVECTIQQTISKVFVVTVVSGADVFLDEIYPDWPSAMTRALQVRDRLVQSGNWTIATARPSSA
jgi:hypothetical protein